MPKNLPSKITPTPHPGTIPQFASSVSLPMGRLLFIVVPITLDIKALN